MKIFKELKKLGYKHYTESTIEELDELPLNSKERIIEQALVLRWLREKYDFHHTIQRNKKYVGIAYSSFVNFSIDEFNTYEEAELACLRKFIEIAKTKEIQCKKTTDDFSELIAETEKRNYYTIEDVFDSDELD